MVSFSLDQLQHIHYLLRACGQQSQEMAASSFQVFEKGTHDYVTTVDRALDQRLTAGFSALFPNDGVITEENPQSWQSLNENYRRFWLIDPLDGTEDFIQRKQHYSIMLGLLEAHEPQAGWVYAPAFDHLYYGGKTLGLFQAVGDAEFVPLVPTPPPPLSKDFCPMIIGDKDQRRFGEAIAQRIPGVQFDCIGSFGLKVLRVVCGYAGIYIYFNGRVKLWDTTGPIALAKTAGLVCCDLTGEPLKFTPDAVNPNTLAHQQPIIVGWANYVETLLPSLQSAFEAVQTYA